MADDVGVMGQADVFVFPVDMFIGGAVAATDLFIDNKGTLHVDLDGSGDGRLARRALGGVSVNYGKSVFDVVEVAGSVEGGHGQERGDSDRMAMRRSRWRATGHTWRNEAGTGSCVPHNRSRLRQLSSDRPRQSVVRDQRV